MCQYLKNQRAIFELDALCSGTGLISGLISAKKTFHIPRKNFEKKKEVFCLLSTIDSHGYTTPKLKAEYFALFVNTPTIITC